MSDFIVPIVPITLEEHPNADALEIAKVLGFTCIVQKGIHTNGDLVAYIPEQSIVPDWLISRMNLDGKLAGKAKNRVKAIRLRGVYSEGLILPLEREDGHTFLPCEEEMGYEWIVHQGMNVADKLGIVKYQPPIPASLNGVAGGADIEMIPKYDFNSIESNPYLFDDGEEIIATEKIHGTCCIVGTAESKFIEKYGDRLIDGHGIVTSKGLAEKGIFFDDNQANEKNTYISVARELQLHEKLKEWADGKNVFIFGEIFGPKIQDLHYVDKITYRAFDIYVGTRQRGEYLSHEEFVKVCDELGIERVPEVYSGPYSYEKVAELSRGESVISEPGKNKDNMKEGIVFKNTKGGDERKIAKRVGEQYKLRKGGTEYN